jgi:hypothetical protein
VVGMGCRFPGGIESNLCVLEPIKSKQPWWPTFVSSSEKKRNPKNTKAEDQEEEEAAKGEEEAGRGRTAGGR